MICALAFERLGVERLTAWANTRNGRSQRALERIGFRREGVLNAWHRHGDRVHDVVIFGMVRAAWERSPLRDVPVRGRGHARRRRSCSADRVRWVATTQASTASAATPSPVVTVSPSSSADHTSVRTGCASWICPILRDAAERQPVVPGEEAEEHRDHGDVGEAEPRVRAGVHAVARRDRHRDHEKRALHTQRPADHLPAAVRAAERPALGVPEPGERDRRQHQQVGASRSR